MNEIIAYKLFRIKKDGNITSLFINKKETLPINKWLKSKEYPTKGFAVRKGFHALKEPVAPHLSKKDRVWYKVKIKNFLEFSRPKSQGGEWVLGDKMLILEKL